MALRASMLLTCIWRENVASSFRPDCCAIKMLDGYLVGLMACCE